MFVLVFACRRLHDLHFQHFSDPRFCITFGPGNTQALFLVSRLNRDIRACQRVSLFLGPFPEAKHSRGEGFKRHRLTRWINTPQIFFFFYNGNRGQGVMLTCLTDWAARACQPVCSSLADPTSARLWDESSWWRWEPPRTCAHRQHRPSSACRNRKHPEISHLRWCKTK